MYIFYTSFFSKFIIIKEVLNINNTIVAIATPLAVGGISVIRISGNHAIDIADKIFKALNNKKLKDIDGYTALYGNIYSKNEIIDDAIALVFRSPKSYTGEDVVEISCHGGIYITKKVLRNIVDNGATIAKPGEFTKRAFLNGKLSITQAESVIDIINSNNDISLKSAISIMNGDLFKKISSINQELLNIIGHLEAWVDFPEEDIEVVKYDNIVDNIVNINLELENIMKSYDLVKLSKDGIDTCIVGKPNVGKSTLMNILAGYQKSIVTDIAGTTRDIVEEQINIGDVILNISDTAGIRETDDTVEKIGVDIAKNKIKVSNLILFIVDSSRELSDEDHYLIDLLKNEKCILIINKTDMPCKIDLKYLKSIFSNVVEISAINSTGIDNLRNIIIDLFNMNKFDSYSTLIANERQRECLNIAISNLKSSIDNLKFGYTLDAITITLESAVESLLELTGEKITDAVVDKIFSNFCVGK